MVPAMRTYHEGWVISTACWDESPDEWKIGDPFQCYASGKAELILPHARSGAWLSKANIIAPAEKSILFADYKVAHATIANSLREMIDALKVP
jgi:hypothetical protein